MAHKIWVKRGKNWNAGILMLFQAAVMVWGGGGRGAQGGERGGIENTAGKEEKLQPSLGRYQLNPEL